MKSIKYKCLAVMTAVLGALFITSCTDDLNTLPIDPNEVVGEIVYGKEIGAYKSGLAKIYAGLAISGNKGGDDESDVAGVDGGSQASFLRGLWNLQELPTDEAHCCWGDIGVNDFNILAWNSTNVFVKGLYYRLYYQINLVNEYLRETAEDKLSSREVDETVKSEIRIFREDARFMRALAYYYLLDMFRNVPFVTEESVVGKEAAPQIMAENLFAYVEKELTECQNGLLDPFVGYNSKYYGRVTKAAAWALLSRLYLNAETYTGEKKYTESLTYSNKVLGAGYQLEPNYADMFKADNGNSREMIFPIRYEGEDTQTWGGMTFLLCSTVPSSMQTGINAQGAWQGNRARSSLQETFAKQSGNSKDSRYTMLYPGLADNVNIVDPSNYKNGIPVVKYSNVNKNGSLPPSNVVYTDFPLFRLGEIYLNYAEAVLRGGSGGSSSTALACINDLRKRAYGNDASAEINQASLTLDFILDERSRELFFEAQRRTDLVRFDKLTTNSYIWQWKGGTYNGTSVDKKFNIYPVPADDISANPNLTQNEGYN
ncbi:MAG: RagB/SusD family nutrient uptake outer membrane protein [Prevotella sp.]|jgi:hypothetical protein|nr:RagB/SusD family nutrient uptake outer membrane protein [Prevotella sp.]